MSLKISNRKDYNYCKLYFYDVPIGQVLWKFLIPIGFLIYDKVKLLVCPPAHVNMYIAINLPTLPVSRYKVPPTFCKSQPPILGTSVLNRYPIEKGN